MLSHHLQQSIVETLSTRDELSFSELKPDEVDNKLFTYHLKIVIREGFVEKTNKGHYRLTPTGQKLWRRMREKPEVISIRAFSILFLVVRRSDGAWLLYKRNTHPLKDKVGFMHVVPKASEQVNETATREVYERTGLTCSFSVAGCGFFHTYHDDNIDGFTNFTLMLCDVPFGQLTPNDRSADYFWVSRPDFSAPDMLPNMKLLVDALGSDSLPFFMDETVSY